MSLGLSALLLAALTLPTQAEFVAGGRLENRSGVSPRVPGQPSLSAFDFIVVPSASLFLRGQELNFGLLYSPRLFMRGGDGNEEFRPLLFHQVQTNLEWSPSPRLRLGLTGRGSAGTINYSYLFSASGDPAGDNTVSPAGETLEFLTSELGLQGSYRASQFVSVAAAASIAYSGPLGAMGASIREQLRNRADVSVTLAPGPRTALELGLQGEVVEFPGSPPELAANLGFFNPRVGLVYRFDSRYSCTGRVGLLMLFSPERPGPIGGQAILGGNSIVPSGEVACSGDAYRSPDLRIGGNVAMGVVGFANPLLGRVDARATLRLNLAFVFPPRWSVQPAVSVLTPASLSQLEDDGAGGVGAVLTETTVNAQLPFLYQLSDPVSLEFGGRFMARGPRVVAPNFELSNIDAQVYVAINLQFSTQSRRVRP